jgi:hypothetical protein
MRLLATPTQPPTEDTSNQHKHRSDETRHNQQIEHNHKDAPLFLNML